MEKIKSASYIIMRILAIGIGLAFPFLSGIWKAMILILFLIFRLIDIERERNLFGATSLFFIGMIMAYLYKVLTG